MVDQPFKVDLDHLDQIAARLNGLAGFIEDKLEELNNTVARLQVENLWTGAAAAAYADAHQQWVAAAAEFNAGVQEMQAAAVEARANYQNSVTLNVQMMRSGRA
ncbi:WXG100 family type VII secretion target [Nocardia vinacea]|uniref:WXG100 family type VII secretion target n=1 Tax=Nocardia vinacea TaxID=96468 RepID=UPI0002F4DFA2|nr:WXG100 family type VII secretion target [Nocardia vinacea]